MPAASGEAGGVSAVGRRGGGIWGVVHGSVNTLFAMDPSMGGRSWAGGSWIRSERAAGALYGKGAGDLGGYRKPSNKRSKGATSLMRASKEALRLHSHEVTDKAW